MGGAFEEQGTPSPAKEVGGEDRNERDFSRSKKQFLVE
jgi:hypothetical protein